MVVAVTHYNFSCGSASDSMRMMKLTRVRAIAAKSCHLLSTITKDGYAVFFTICYYDLSSLVYCHSPWLVEACDNVGWDGSEHCYTEGAVFNFSSFHSDVELVSSAVLWLVATLFCSLPISSDSARPVTGHQFTAHHCWTLVLYPLLIHDIDCS